MNAKLIFITVLGFILLGVLFMYYGQTLSIDCIGAALTLAGGGLAVYDCVKRKKRASLIPLAVSLIALITTGFIQFDGSILVAAFGFIALGLYICLTLYKTH